MDILTYTDIQPTYPYTGPFTETQWRAVIKKAKPSLPSSSVAACRKVDKLIADALKEQEKYQTRFVRDEFRRALNVHTEAIATGKKGLVELESISEDSIAEQYATKATALDEVQRHAIRAIRPDVIKIHEAVFDAVDKFAEGMEKAERAAADEFGVEFEASPSLRLVQTTVMFLSRITPKKQYEDGEGLPRPSGSLFYLGADYSL